jgi:hypothetical protein
MQIIDKEVRHTTGGLAIWRGDEYILNFLFDIGLRLRARRITPNNRISNELLVINLAAVTG